MSFSTVDLFAVALFFISFFGLITTRNIIKSIIFTLIMQASVIMFWLFVGARAGHMPPIFEDPTYFGGMDNMADPLPQALMLTAIIIGVSVVAINITMLNTLFRKHKTTDWEKIAHAAKDDDKLITEKQKVAINDGTEDH